MSLRGIIPPLVTPLARRDELDKPGLARLIEHLIDGGVSGVFVLGTTGEAPSLSYRLRRELISEVTRLVAGRIQVLVGITDTSFIESVDLAKHASDCGADAVVLTTPYYFPAGQTELQSYIRNISGELTLPLVLYNMPQLTKVWFDIETLKQLTEIDSIIGVKDSSGDLDYFARLCELKSIRPDWSIMIGPEAMLGEAMASGADGAVAGGANVFPRLFVDRYDALVAGDTTKADEAQRQITIFQGIYDVGKYASRHIKATKCALSLTGICDDLPADPFHRFHAAEREKVASVLRRMNAFPDRQSPGEQQETTA